MISWIEQNLANIIISVVFAAAVAAAVITVVRNKKNGKTGCGCDCSASNCPSDRRGK